MSDRMTLTSLPNDIQQRILSTYVLPIVSHSKHPEKDLLSIRLTNVSICRAIDSLLEPRKNNKCAHCEKTVSIQSCLLRTMPRCATGLRFLSLQRECCDASRMGVLKSISTVHPHSALPLIYCNTLSDALELSSFPFKFFVDARTTFHPSIFEGFQNDALVSLRLFGVSFLTISAIQRFVERWPCQKLRRFLLDFRIDYHFTNINNPDASLIVYHSNEIDRERTSPRNADQKMSEEECVRRTCQQLICLLPERTSIQVHAGDEFEFEFADRITDVKRNFIPADRVKNMFARCMDTGSGQPGIIWNPLFNCRSFSPKSYQQSSKPLCTASFMETGARQVCILDKCEKLWKLQLPAVSLVVANSQAVVKLPRSSHSEPLDKTALKCLAFRTSKLLESGLRKMDYTKLQAIHIDSTFYDQVGYKGLSEVNEHFDSDSEEEDTLNCHKAIENRRRSHPWELTDPERVQHSIHQVLREKEEERNMENEKGIEVLAKLAGPSLRALQCYTFSDAFASRKDGTSREYAYSLFKHAPLLKHIRALDISGSVLRAAIKSDGGSKLDQLFTLLTCLEWLHVRDGIRPVKFYQRNYTGPEPKYTLLSPAKSGRRMHRSARTAVKYLAAVRKNCPNIQGVILIHDERTKCISSTAFDRAREVDREIELRMREEAKSGNSEKNQKHDVLPELRKELKLCEEARPSIDVTSMEEALEFWTKALHHLHVPSALWV